MKKLFGILFGFAVLTILVLTPPGETIKMYEKQSIETVSVDVINIDGIELQSAEIIYTIDVTEVGISPYYVIEGVYYSEFSRNSNISNDDTYALNIDYDNSVYETTWYCSNNYVLYSFGLNSDIVNSMTQFINKGENHIESLEVFGLTPLCKQNLTT